MADAAVNVVVALVLRGDRLLVEQRSAADPHSPGAVRFPAGHVEPGETLEEALRREVREELGLRVRSCRKVREGDFTGADAVTRRLHYFLVSLSEPPPTGEPWRWLARAEAPAMDFEADRALVRELL